MKTTVCIQIGNSDDKLSQREWWSYCTDVSVACLQTEADIHFRGGPATNFPYQNYCFVLEAEDNVLASLKAGIVEIRKKYGQDSVAWTEGRTEFV